MKTHLHEMSFVASVAIAVKTGDHGLAIIENTSVGSIHGGSDKLRLAAILRASLLSCSSLLQYSY